MNLERLDLAGRAAYQITAVSRALLDHALNLEGAGVQTDTVALIRAHAGRAFVLSEAINDAIHEAEEVTVDDLAKVICLEVPHD